MKKAHLNYLRKAINIVLNSMKLVRGSEMVTYLNALKSYRPPVYGYIRNLVTDIRFYGVTENDSFWRIYSVAEISGHIDCISEEEWKDPEKLETRLRCFLKEWYEKHHATMSVSRKNGIMKQLQKGGWMKYSSDSLDIEEDSETEEDEDESEDIFEEDMRSVSDNTGVSSCDHSYKTGVEMIRNLDRRLIRLARMIGRSGSESVMIENGRFCHSRKSDISGVTVGNDLNSVLPSEIALLGSKNTENIFYRKFAQKRLQIFSSNSSSPSKRAKKKKGPIIMCVDTSGSMQGYPEKMAKSLALAISIIAQREKRPVCIVNYSTEISFFVLRNLEMQKGSLMSFLSKSYGGGNYESNMFRFILSHMHRLPEYKKFMSRFDGADLLVVSDFFWGPIERNAVMLIEKAQKEGMIFYALGVGLLTGDLSVKKENGKSVHADTRKTVINDGIDFFNRCDHQFIYDGTECKEITPSA